MIALQPRVLRLEIPGIAPSLNRRFGVSKTGRLYELSATKEYKKRIVSIVFSSVLQARWEAPQYAHVTVEIYNMRHDLDNILKAALDSLQGGAVNNDRDITALHVLRVKDELGPRLVIEVKANG